MFYAQAEAWCQHKTGDDMAVIALLNCLDDDETPRAGATPELLATESGRETLAFHVARLLTQTNIDELLLFHPAGVDLAYVTRVAPQITLCPLGIPMFDKLDSIYRETQRVVDSLEPTQEKHRILYVQVSLGNLVNVEPHSFLAPMQYFEDERLQYLSSMLLPKRSFEKEVRLEYTWLDLLYEAWQEALLPDDRLLVTPYIARQDQRLRVAML